MGDFILPTDTLEFQNQRQSIKISYLQQELKQLQEHVQDLENIIKLNKEALRIAVNGNSGAQPQPNNRVKLTGNESTNRSDDVTALIDNKSLHMLIDQLQLENIRLLHIIDKVTKQRNRAQSQVIKALINEQISEETERRENETITELREKIYEMKKALQDKEYVIQELEKIKPIHQEKGLVIKYKEISTPNEAALKLQDEVENLTKMLSKVTQELNKTQEEREELKLMNITLTAELQKLANRFSNPLYDTRGGQDDSVVDDPDHVLFPDKVKQKPPTQAKTPIPKLDLTKAKQIQDFNAKKSTLEQQQAAANQTQASDPKLKEKVTQLTEEIETTKKLLAREMVNNRLLSEQIEGMRRQNRELVNVNDTLIRANQRYEEKWQKIYYTLEFYKEFYYKHFEVVTTRFQLSKNSTNKFKNLEKLKLKLNLDEKEITPDQVIQQLKRIDEENGEQGIIGMLEAEEDNKTTATPQKQKSQGAEMNLEMCKVYLARLAQDIEHRLQFNKSHAKKWKQVDKRADNDAQINDPFALRRSKSNIFDGLEEKKKKLVFDQGGLFQLNAQKKSNVELANPLIGIRKFGSEEEEKGTATKSGFNLDLSIIDPNGKKEVYTPMPRVNLMINIPNSNAAGKKRQGTYEIDGPSFTQSPDKYQDVSFISNNDIFE